MPDRHEDERTADRPAVPLPNQGGIGSSEHGGTDSADLIPDDDRERRRERAADPADSETREEHRGGRRETPSR